MMLGFRIATRFLKSNKGQTFLIILGIAIGVSVQIFIGSLIQGLQKGLIDKTIGNSPHISITSDSEEGKITNYEELAEQIRLADPNISEVSVTYDNSALMEYGDQSQSLLIRGLVIEQADNIYDIKERMVAGTYPQNDNEIIIGIDLKDEYGIDIGDEIRITTANQKIVFCKVTGFFDFKVSSLNTGWGITTLSTAQDIFDTEDIISGIEIQVNEDSIFLADKISLKIQNQIQNDNLKFTNWKEQNESLLSGLQGQSISSYMIQIFVIISVVLGIASVLAITVIQKSKQIGILKALGIRNSTTSIIFILEGLILGFFGALLGILLGLGLSFAFTKFALNPDGTPVVDLYINYSFLLFSGMIAIVASTLAAMIPAVNSFRLNAIDIIRNN